ncbi:protein CHUP1, chloroplastic-like isoform X2 [Salvia splendens]|uniref:protein CHUP1, chloroplastic-like isoform X2 n=1 Tax=Salvia splendens TaxID=180675 RepID=UPI001C26F94D|nr:protein CHUP1, chloroplastic-like isoform X2 [Salvia splendens]
MQKQISWSISKRDGPISPVLFKFGVALAFSLGGIVFTFLRSKRIMLPKPKPKPSPPSPGRADSDVGADHPPLKLNITRVSSRNSMSDVSSSEGRSVGDRDGFLFHELDQLVKEYDMETDNASRGKSGLSLEPNVEPIEEDERELVSLRSKVQILEEREKILENQLLEYYGLKEQENAVLELQNRLRVHSMEAKLYNIKIESLQSDNKKLQAKVADYDKVVAELESAQAKITLLRKKLRFEAKQNREQILRLQERVMKLQDQDSKAVEADQDSETQSRERSHRLEEELEETKRYNQSLKLENLELAQKIESLQILAKSTLDDKEVQALKEESRLLRRQNEDFRKEIDQLQADRCTDAEELVYLRWINACLRYELRNYQPGQDETIARDLSKTLSPKSEEKAKKLILAYANREGTGCKDPDIEEFYHDDWSISQNSYLTDSGDPDDLPIDNLHDNKASHRNKRRVFTKLMKLLRGKDNDYRVQTPPSLLRQRAASVDDALSRTDGDGFTKTATTSSGTSSRQSFYLQRSYSQGQKSATAESSRRMSEDSSLSIFRSFDTIAGYDDSPSSGSQPGQEAQSAAKTELVKYAKALKDSRPRPRRRSVTFGSF